MKTTKNDDDLKVVTNKKIYNNNESDEFFFCFFGVGGRVRLLLKLISMKNKGRTRKKFFKITNYIVK